jgi:hypothetical protein
MAAVMAERVSLSPNLISCHGSAIGFMLSQKRTAYGYGNCVILIDDRNCAEIEQLREGILRHKVFVPLRFE